MNPDPQGLAGWLTALGLCLVFLALWRGAPRREAPPQQTLEESLNSSRAAARPASSRVGS